MHDFLWEAVDEGKGKGVHMVRWEVIEKLVSLGGLDIGNRRARNKGFLAKWLSCFSLEPNSSWCRIIASTLGPILSSG